MNDTPDFHVQCDAERSVLRGVMRLESVQAYDGVLGSVRAAVDAASAEYTIDVADLVFLNSSGIRAVGDLVLFARARGKKLTVECTARIPWQRKTFSSLTRIYDGLRVTMR